MKAKKKQMQAPVAALAVLPAGYSVCQFLRAFGYAGFTAKQAGALCGAGGLLEGTSPNTVSCQVGAGRQYAAGASKPHHTGGILAFTPEVLAQVVALVGEPAKPHAETHAAPLPGVRGVAQPAPVPVPEPVKPAKKKPAKK